MNLTGQDARQGMAQAADGGGLSARLARLERRVESLDRRTRRIFFAQIDTQQNTTAAAYVDLATDGPSIVIPAAGDYLIDGGAGTYISAGTPVSFVGIFANGALVRQMQNNLSATAQIVHPASATQALALPAGAIVKLRYGAFSGCTAEFFNRWIKATRL